MLFAAVLLHRLSLKGRGLRTNPTLLSLGHHQVCFQLPALRVPKSGLLIRLIERSESYFSGSVAAAAEDPAMAEPLTLGDKNTSEDQSFLGQVDSKLEEAVRHDAPVQGTSDQTDIISDPPENDPKLKFKRSMNFGSQLGGSKGF